MKTILQRLEEMPLAMLVRVSRKFKLNIKVDETRESIIQRLDELITDYLLESEEQEDTCIDGTLSKFNLLADFEVPHEISLEKNSTQNFITYIDIILIDNNWSYIYWDISKHDYERINKSSDFIGLEIHVLYNQDGFNGNYISFEAEDIISITLEDSEYNFYQCIHNSHACCVLVAKFKNTKQLLAVSGEIYLPHALPIWERKSIADSKYDLLMLSLGKSEEFHSPIYNARVEENTN